MADGTQAESFDPSQDADFLKAPPERQHAYLTSVDPDYAKASPERQKAYLDHVNGSHEAGTAAIPPVAPLPPINVVRNMHGVHQYPALSPNEREKQRQLIEESGGAGSLGVPLVVAARGLETIARNREQQNLRDAATGRTREVPIPPEANIALPENPAIRETGDRTTPFLARSGADILRGAAGMLTPQSETIAGAAAVMPAVIGTGLALHGSYNALKEMPAAFQGNPDAMQRALNAAAEATGGGALAGEGVATGAPDVEALKNIGTRAIESRGGLKTLGIVKPEPAQALTRAIQPGVNIPRAQESIPIAGPRLQQVKEAGLITDDDGNPVTEFKSNKDILDGVKAAKQYVWNALEQRAGRVANLQADTSGAADAMERSVSKRTREQYPEIAARIERRAATYRGLKSLRDIEEAIQDANNDLRGYYKRSTPTDSPVTAETAATEAEVKYLRNLLDEKVQSLTGSGTKALKREYGALRDVERAAAKQYAVETRQKGATLWEGLAALRAAGDFVSGNILGAAKGAATIAVGRRLGVVRSPQWNIDQAFQGPKAFKAAGEITPATGPNIRGFLPEGPKATPPPRDMSGPVNLGTPFVAEGTRAARKGLLLPERTGPALDVTQRGPQGGPEPNQTPPPFGMPPSSLPPEQPPAPTRPGGMPPAPIREVMAQTPKTSRATPTGNGGTLPAGLKADLEKQAGRKLTDQEAIALDRANLERGMAAGERADLGAIREAHRQTLEKKGRR